MTVHATFSGACIRDDATGETTHFASVSEAWDARLAALRLAASINRNSGASV